MYSKIAIGNVKKSFKDYSIYFLTLTLAVCIFYSFNSIESQKALMDMNSSATDYVEMLTTVISYLSVFVSMILGSLILYANNFLIKKRKKELGVYMTLGMGKNKISKILVMETFIVGIISLASGLLLGLVASQGLSIFTSKLFDVSMSEYNFVISFSAIGKTVLYFGIMFLLVIIFNVFVISKYKIIDLLSAGRKNESIKIKNPFIYLLTFILCVLSLTYAYKLVLEAGLDISDSRFVISIVLGVLGTVLFFFSLAGFGLYITKRSKKIYFKNLNIFTINQVNSKVNTNFISMSVICLMLFLTIGVLSTGLSFKDSIEKGLENSTPFDATATMYLDKENKVQNIEESFKNMGFKFDKSEKFVSYKEYAMEVTIGELLKNSSNTNNDTKKQLDKFSHMSAYAMKLSEYNNVRKFSNKNEFTLNNNEILITSNNADVAKGLNLFLENNKSIEIDGKEYIIKNKKVIEDTIRTNPINDMIFNVVVSDEISNSLEPILAYMNIDFTGGNKEKSESKFVELFGKYKKGGFDFDKTGFVNGYTREQIYAESKGMTTTILFVGIYLGVVFLISSMAVLALQQLSEASDSVDRYKSLRRIGANEKMINRTIFAQTLVYFSLPVGLAFVHSVVGIKVANDFIAMFNKPDIGMSSLFTALIFMVVYVGYFFATYTGYKNIVKNS